MFDAVSRLSRLISYTTVYAAAAGLVAMVLIIAWQVFARYVLSSAPPWSEQAALVLMIWFVFLAGAAGVREQFHIGMDFALGRLSGRTAKVARALIHALILLFGVALFLGGLELVVRTWSHVMPALGIPRGAAYLPAPASGLLIIFFSLEHLWAGATGREVKPLWP
jgi:TRAP-type C4-dicarboxylate transport system permease small subunit